MVLVFQSFVSNGTKASSKGHLLICNGKDHAISKRFKKTACQAAMFEPSQYLHSCSVLLAILKFKYVNSNAFLSHCCIHRMRVHCYIACNKQLSAPSQFGIASGCVVLSPINQASMWHSINICLSFSQSQNHLSVALPAQLPKCCSKPTACALQLPHASHEVHEGHDQADEDNQ